MISRRSWARWNGWHWYVRRWARPSGESTIDTARKNGATNRWEAIKGRICDAAAFGYPIFARRVAGLLRAIARTARDTGLDRRRHQRRAAEPGRAVCVALAGFAAAGDARAAAGRHGAGGAPGAAPDQPRTARDRQQHARRQRPDRDAGRDCS